MSLKCVHESYVTSLTNTTPINLIKRTELTLCQGLFHQKKVPISKANGSRSSCEANACQVGICLETANYQHLCSAWKPFLQKNRKQFYPAADWKASTSAQRAQRAEIHVKLTLRIKSSVGNLVALASWGPTRP